MLTNNTIQFLINHLINKSLKLFINKPMIIMHMKEEKNQGQKGSLNNLKNARNIERRKINSLIEMLRNKKLTLNRMFLKKI